MPKSPERSDSSNDFMIGDIFSRRALIAAGITAATGLVLSAFDSRQDPSCYIGGTRSRQSNRMGLGKMFKCTVNDPLVRVNTGLLIALGTAAALSKETSI